MMKKATEMVLNDLGTRSLTHWVTEPCGKVAPGDCVEHSDPKNVDCPDCLAEFARLRKGRELPQVSPAQKPTLTMNFFDALREVVKGKKITKLEWNDREFYIALFFTERLSNDTPAGRYLCIRKPGSITQPICVSDGDLLGTDWIVIE
jgi:hypothetical protein